MRIRRIPACYLCPVTGDQFKTEEAARNHATKIIEAEKRADKRKKAEEKRADFQRDYLRLHVESVDQIAPMILDKGKEFFGLEFKNLDMTFRFEENKSTNYDTPISGKGGAGILLPAFNGQISGEIKKAKYARRDDCYLGVDLIFGGAFSHQKQTFRGIRTGSGGGGEKWQYSFTMFLCDFPKLQTKYAQYVDLKIAAEIHASKLNDIAIAAQEVAGQNEAYLAEMNEKKKWNDLMNKSIENARLIFESIKRLEMDKNKISDPIDRCTLFELQQNFR